MLKLWGRPTSSNTQKVIWCMAELGIEAERIDAGGEFGGLDTPEYLRRNPNGTIPTLEDSDTGFVLWESNTIVRYLSMKFGQGSLYPDALDVRARADMWMEWQQTTLRTAILPVFKDYMAREPNTSPEPATVRAIEQTGKLFAMADAYLEHNTYLAGETFTMGDIPLAVWTNRYRVMVQNPPPLPNLMRWFGLLQQRDAFREAVMVPLK